MGGVSYSIISLVTERGARIERNVFLRILPKRPPPPSVGSVFSPLIALVEIRLSEGRSSLLSLP